MKLLVFREAINPENAAYSPLKKQAIKIDGQTKGGLKAVLDCQAVKSCDYFRLKKGGIGINFIEISDLKLQMRNSQDKKSEHAVIRKEMINKFVGTAVIYLLLERRIKSTTSSALPKQRIFSTFIIAIFSQNRSDVMAFQALKHEVKSGLQSIVGDVFVVPFDTLGDVL